MPRICSFTLLYVVGVAFMLDDYERAVNVRLGVTEEHARRRCLLAAGR